MVQRILGVIRVQADLTPQNRDVDLRAFLVLSRLLVVEDVLIGLDRYIGGERNRAVDANVRVGHSLHLGRAKEEQDSLFDPSVRLPFAIDFLSHSDLSAVKSRDSLLDSLRDIGLVGGEVSLKCLCDQLFGIRHGDGGSQAASFAPPRSGKGARFR